MEGEEGVQNFIVEHAIGIDATRAGEVVVVAFSP